MAHSFLESSAERVPHQVALHWDDHSTQGSSPPSLALTYRQLFRWAQAVAGRLTNLYGAGLLRGSPPDPEIGKALVALAIDEVPYP